MIRSRSGLALVVLLGAAMVTSTLLQGALGVLSRFIIDEFGIARSQFGLVFAAYSLIGGISSLYLGTLADRSSRVVMFGLFTLAAVGIAGAALAPSYVVLLVAVLLGGLALGAGNPVTNRVVAERISLARRGLVIGIKQAGPPLGIFLAGVVLPTIAVAASWRLALLTALVLPLAGLAVTSRLIPANAGTGPAPSRVSDLDDIVRFVVRWLTFIGFVVALANAAAIAFLPLFAQEELGMTPTLAGMVAASMGLAGVVGRVAWGALGGRFRRPSTALLLISVLSAVSFGAIAVSGTLGVVWLWLGAIGSGVSVLAWHAVAWLVIIDRVDISAVGRASGVMHMGSTLGFAVGAPAAGLLLDMSGSYGLTWSLLAALMGVVVVVTTQFRLRGARR